MTNELDAGRAIEILEDDELEQENAAMGEQMDAERAAFEFAANQKFYGGLAAVGDTWSEDRGMYVDPAHHMAWWAWQQRASLPVGVPDELREASVVGFKPGMGEVTLYVGRLPTWLDMGHTCYVSAAPAAPTVKADAKPTEWQPVEKMEVSHHYVAIGGGGASGGGSGPVQAFGSNGRISLNAPTVKAEQVQCEECGGNGAGGDHEDDCSKAPSLPAAGSAVEEVSSFHLPDSSDFYGFGYVDGTCIQSLRGVRDHLKDLLDAIPDEPLMTVAQYSRIVAALSAQQSAQSAPERVSVPQSWRVVERPTCFALLDGNQVIATLAGPESEENAEIIATLIRHGRGEA